MAPRAQHPAHRLREAAITFAAAVEAENPHDISVEWDRLRRAALNYREGPRPDGRPRGPEHISTVLGRALEGIRKAEG
jgi:hypothetical protein